MTSNRENSAQIVTSLELIAATFVLGFVLQLEFAALRDLDILLWLVTTGLFEILDLVNNFVALEDLAENNVAAIKPSTWG